MYDYNFIKNITKNASNTTNDFIMHDSKINLKKPNRQLKGSGQQLGTLQKKSVD